MEKLNNYNRWHEKLTMVRTRMKDRSRQLNVTKMAGTLRHSFTASLALEIPVNCTHPRIHKSPSFRLVCRFIHNLWMFNLGNRVGFLQLQFWSRHC